MHPFTRSGLLLLISRLNRWALLLPAIALVAALGAPGFYGLVSYRNSAAHLQTLVSAELRQVAQPVDGMLAEIGSVADHSARILAESNGDASAVAGRLTMLAADRPGVAEIVVFDNAGHLLVQTGALPLTTEAQQSLLGDRDRDGVPWLASTLKLAGKEFGGVAMRYRNTAGDAVGSVAVLFPLQPIRHWLALATLPRGGELALFRGDRKVWFDASGAARVRDRPGSPFVRLSSFDLDLAAIMPTGAVSGFWWDEAGAALSFFTVVALFISGIVAFVSRSMHREALEREAAVAALAENERRFRELAELAADWTWETDAEHRFTRFDGLLPRTGAVALPLARKRHDLIEGALDPDAIPEYEAALAQCLPFRDFVYRSTRVSGRQNWFKTSGRPVFSPEGKFLGYRGTASDVTGEIESALRARAAERQLVDAVESSPWAFALFNQEDRLVLCNSRFRQQFDGAERGLVAIGATFEEMLRRRVAAGGIVGVGLADEAWIARRLAYHRDPKGSFELELEGGRWLQIIEQRTANDYLISIFTDITDLKLREEELRKSEEQFRLTFDAAPIGMAVQSADGGRYLRTNPALCELLGYTEAEMLQLSHLDTTHPDDRATSSHLYEELRAGRLNHAEYEKRYRAKSGATVTALTRVVVVRDASNRPAQFLTQMVDITTRKQSERELIAAKEQAELANRTKSEFLANMSHELRTPLNAIIGFSEIVAGELFGSLGNKRYVEYARDIHSSGIHLLSIISDILDLSKIEAGRRELYESIVDLYDATESSMRLVRGRAENGNIKLVNAVPRDTPRITADERSVKQILLNLLSNAVKFTREGGCVTVRAARREDGRLAVSIEDTGIGIAAENIGLVLAPFSQVDSSLSRRYEGTGLGLPLVKSLIELHGGELMITSELGCGTAATIIFPASRVD